jgi:hypothetical protein
VVRKLLLAAAAVIAGVAVFGAFYWAQSLPSEIPSEVRTESVLVRVDPVNTTYSAGESVRVELFVKNIGARTLWRPTKITIRQVNSKGESIGSSSTINYFYPHKRALELQPQEEYHNHINILVVDPEVMPPDEYAVVITIEEYQVSVAAPITVK